jgi:hypothetical protein
MVEKVRALTATQGWSVHATEARVLLEHIDWLEDNSIAIDSDYYRDLVASSVARPDHSDVLPDARWQTLNDRWHSGAKLRSEEFGALLDLALEYHMDARRLTAEFARLTAEREDHGPNGRNVTNAQHLAMRERAVAAEARAARAEEALRKIAGPCERLVVGRCTDPGQPYRDDAQYLADLTCDACIATRALTSEGGDRAE